MNISKVGRDLLNSLSIPNHPLEKYIYAIEYNLDDNSALRSIGERIGIFIPEKEDAASYLPFQLKIFLENERNHSLTEKVIHLSPDEYEKYLVSLNDENKNLSREDFYPLYANRLFETI